jgi:hypothetical protein
MFVRIWRAKLHCKLEVSTQVVFLVFEDCPTDNYVIMYNIRATSHHRRCGNNRISTRARSLFMSVVKHRHFSS